MTSSATTHDRVKQAFDRYVDEFHGYYAPWTFDKPITSSLETTNDLKAVGLALNKVIKHVGTNFLSQGYEQLMPVSERACRVFEIFNQRSSYDVGSFRTDFVFDQAKVPKLIEITCRFALNGYFEAAVFNQFSKEHALKLGVDAHRVEEYDAFQSFMADKIGASNRVCIVVRDGKPQSSRYYAPIFEASGIEVNEVHFQELASGAGLMKDALVISEIGLNEIELLSDSDLELLAASNLINDFRTVFTAHDKRFFELLNNKTIQRAALDTSERDLLQRYLIETRAFDEAGSDLDELLANKDRWVLKHARLGKSKDIYAGLEFEQAEWESLLGTLDLQQFILQEWVPQRRFKGTVSGVEFDDYLTGTLMYFDDAYFGLGLFRSSSHIITNKVDDRKMFPLVMRSHEHLRDIPSVFSF